MAEFTLVLDLDDDAPAASIPIALHDCASELARMLRDTYRLNEHAFVCSFAVDDLIDITPLSKDASLKSAELARVE